MLSDNLEGWDGVAGERETQEGENVMSLWLIHIVTCHKPKNTVKRLTYNQK